MVALPSVSVSDVLYGQQGQFGEVQVTYSSGKDLESIAKRLKIMSDVKVGVYDSLRGRERDASTTAWAD